MAQWLSVALLVVLSSLGCCWLLVVASWLLVVLGWQKVRTQAAVFVVPATCVPHHMVATTTLRPKRKERRPFSSLFPHFPCPFLIWPTAPDAISISIDEFHLCSIY